MTYPACPCFECVIDRSVARDEPPYAYERRIERSGELPGGSMCGGEFRRRMRECKRRAAERDRTPEG